MEIVAIASALIFVKVLICYTLLQKCKIAEKVKKEIVKISETMYKENENSSQKSNKQNTKSDSVEVAVKRNPPIKPPRAVRHVKLKSMEKCNNSKNSSEETIFTNNFRTFSNDDYIRSKDYNDRHYCDQCHRLSSEKEARFREVRHSNDVLHTSNELQEQIPSSDIDIDSSKSVPQIPELTKILQLRFLVMNSSESRNSQYSDKIIIKNNETDFMELPKNIYQELGKNIIYPLTSTKIQSKNSLFYKLRKYLTAALRRIRNKCQ
ncbi:hypothetical protein ACS0PU_000988 [Formica fusca]